MNDYEANSPVRHQQQPLLNPAAAGDPNAQHQHMLDQDMLNFD